ncbi:MAG: hypothetical protein EXS36_12275 [Pedosphaera sp.]|nr:hypothetical protein [Pedosphaera sp.]
MRREQGVEALAQRRVAFAFGGERRRSIRRRLAQSELEQEFFTVRVHGCLLSAFASAASISGNDGARQSTTVR